MMAGLLGQIAMSAKRLPRETTWEIIVAQPQGQDAQLEAQVSAAAGKYIPNAGHYGEAFRAALAVASGKYLLTMEPGLAHSPYIIPELFARREEADLIIASRYIRTGFANVGFGRRILSRAGNAFFRTVLDLPAKDLTSSFRLYRRRIFDFVRFESKGLDTLLELLVQSHAAGFRMAEIPFHYFPADSGINDDFTRVGSDSFRRLKELWKLRNSIDCADYDERAFVSRVWFQRSWQRKRYHALVGMSRDCDRILDVGCGSSQVLEGLPQADACDVRLNKLRYKRGRSRPLVRASVFDLPYPSNAYDAVIFSQVIEHLPRDPKILSEIVRVCKPGGHVIVGTPDYNTWWTTIEKIYGFVHPTGYADEHITHYTFDTLKAEVEGLGCTFKQHAYVYHAELIMKFQKRV